VNILSDSADRVFQCLEKYAQKVPTIGSHLDGVGLFKKSGEVWVGLSVPPELLELQKELAVTLEMDPGHFHAHFTRGRIKGGRPEENFFQCLEQTDVKLVPFKIGSIALVQSELLPEGVRHTVLAHVRLA